MQPISFIRRALAATALAAACLATAPATAQEDYSWISTTYNDEADGGRYTAALTLGVPETDDRQFHSTCSPRGQSTVLGYNTGNLPNGRHVVVDFFQNGRNVYSKSATVYAGAHSEAISGVLFNTEVNDGLWVTLKRGRSIRYRIRGHKRARMTLRGSSRAIEIYRQNCRAIQTASSGAGTYNDEDNEENNVSSARSCRDFGRVKSRNSQQPITIRFTNNSGSHRSVMWIDYNGQPKHYRDLAAGESYAQKTFVGHPWMFTDGPGNCKEMFTPVYGAGNNFAITYDE